MHPLLGRLEEFDTRNESYSVNLALELKDPKTMFWPSLHQFDQGNIPQCVGFSFATLLSSNPQRVRGVVPSTAEAIYHTAQRLDPWAGHIHDGSTVLAGIKAVKKLYPGTMQDYRWAFPFEDILRTLSYIGPVVLGIDWHQDMFTPNDNHIISPGDSKKVGGHAICANGVSMENRLVRLKNTWGYNWGTHGQAFISFEDLEKLFYQKGECCAPIFKRQTHV